MAVIGDNARASALSRRLGSALIEAAPRAIDIGQATEALRSRVQVDISQWWSQAQGANDGPVDVIDLFSGCGGMSAGFRAVNALFPAFRQILAIDIDSAANRTYEANLGLAPEAVNVHELAESPSLLEELLAKSRRRKSAPLVLIGCAPCQGFSSHRNSAGAGDARNGLFVDFAKIAARLQPDFVVVENVPELLTDGYWSVLMEAKRLLRDAGYVIHVSVHNMAEFGVPQERFRALMLASKRPFEPLVGRLTYESFRTVQDAIGALPVIEPGEAHPADEMHVTAGHRESTLQTIRAVPKDGGNRSFEAGPASLRALHLRQGKPAYEDVYGRLAWGKPAITITAYSRNPASGRYVHPEQDRGLSVREASLLQAFPDTYSFIGSFDEKFRQVGNAVPPVFAAHLALTLLREIASPTSADLVDEGVAGPMGKSFARLIPSLKAQSKRNSAPAVEARIAV